MALGLVGVKADDSDEADEGLCGFLPLSFGRAGGSGVGPGVALGVDGAEDRGLQLPIADSALSMAAKDSARA